MKLQLLCTNSLLKSQALKEIATGLSTRLGYKIWRTTKVNLKRSQLKYGPGVNKLSQYIWFKENEIPSLEFTTEREQVCSWLHAGCTVFGRKYQNSSCGKGIVVMEPTVESVTTCPVYTKYKKKKREFRVHIFKDQIVAVVEKKRKSNYEGIRDSKIRNLANGYIFSQVVENEPARLRELALKACKVTSSDFCGVDVGYNEVKDELFIIEVNSAPGIQGSNISAYINVILGV